MQFNDANVEMEFADTNAEMQLRDTTNSYADYAEFKKKNKIPSLLDQSNLLYRNS